MALLFPLSSLSPLGQTVEGICKNHVKALGATDSIRSIKMEQEVSVAGNKFRVYIYMQPGKAMYQRTETPMGNDVICV